MAMIAYLTLGLLVTASAGVGTVSGQENTRPKTQVSFDIFMSSKLPEGLKCDDYHCGSTPECPKTCYCGEWNLCTPYDPSCPNIVCLKDDQEYKWCPDGCYCTDHSECDYTEREN